MTLWTQISYQQARNWKRFMNSEMTDYKTPEDRTDRLQSVSLVRGSLISSVFRQFSLPTTGKFPYFFAIAFL